MIVPSFMSILMWQLLYYIKHLSYQQGFNVFLDGTLTFHSLQYTLSVPTLLPTINQQHTMCWNTHKRRYWIIFQIITIEVTNLRLFSTYSSEILVIEELPQGLLPYLAKSEWWSACHVQRPEMSSKWALHSYPLETTGAPPSTRK